MGWYKAGTVSVTAGSNAVIGSGTSFIANARVGDAFRGPDGRWYEVSNIASDTALSIAPNYQGTTAAGGGYSLAPMQGYVKESADQLRAATKVIAATATDMSAQIDQARVSAESATASAGTATTKAAEASASSANATTRAAAALVSQNAAKTSETNAKTYADQAAASASVPLSTPLTGLSVAISATITTSDTILSGFGKLQAQNTLGGWGTAGPGSVADINAIDTSRKFSINTPATTANIPFVRGSSTTQFAAGSNGLMLNWSVGSHWQALIFNRTTNDIVLRRSTSGVVQADDYLVVYPTGKTVLDISQGGTGSATGVPNMVGATASVAGVKGLVPAPAAGDQAKFLTGAGTYASPPTAAWGGITGLLSAQTDLQTALNAKLDDSLAGYVMLYPNGTPAAPATIAANSRVLVDNPFPGAPVIPIAEVLFNGIWSDPGFLFGSGAGYGTKASKVDVGDKIAIQTGSLQVLAASAQAGGGHNTTSNASGPLPYRLRVWRIKG
ncbi:hypothetical protein N0U25_13195 [Pseudomonas sivasensis]|uniref:hypothetical protein n=1 Tax=Pseudomonas sivasensis TaxID=1880678 RepID=UPI0021AA013C|nr:hypothetical protein [Pseudomonas sivasensis]MCT4498754.1 hypothetical protein [Pseudomonas sivasensis]